MANVIYVDANDNKGFSPGFPLLDDVQITLNNTYQSIGDLVGGLNDVVNMGKQYVSVWDASLPGELATFSNVLSFPRWQNTDPIKINVKLLFYVGWDKSIKGSKNDVIDAMNFFIERATLSVKGNKLVVPGVSLGEVLSTSNITSEEKNRREKLSNQSKLLKICIPGVIYMGHVFIETIAPVYSRQKTKEGYPIWGTLDIQFSGVTSAMFSNFKDVPTNDVSIIAGEF